MILKSSKNKDITSETETFDKSGDINIHALTLVPDAKSRGDTYDMEFIEHGPISNKGQYEHDEDSL